MTGGPLFATAPPFGRLRTRLPLRHDGRERLMASLSNHEAAP
jgi:hypothetical protein